MASEVQNITQIPVNIQAWLLPHFTEGSYQDMRRASVGFSSFPFAFNEESPDPYSASVKALAFSGVFVSFMFALVLLRAWIVFKYGSPFVMWSVNTLSCCSVSLCGVLALGYYPLMIAYSVRYVEWERRRPPDIPKTGRVGDLAWEYDPYSLEIPAGIVRARVVARYLLLAVQWTVKIAFLSIFFEFRHSCKKVHKIILHCITFITASCILSTTGYIIAENTRILKLEKQLGYQHIHPDSGLPLVLTIPEYILAAMDLFIDLLIVFFTAIILRSLQLNRSQKIRSLIFISPGFITVVIAVARCIILLGMQAPQNQARKQMLREGWKAFEADPSQVLLRGGDQWAENYRRRIWALSLLTPLGTFMSVYVACLPAFRVLMRGWSEKEQRKSGKSAESGSFSAVDFDSSDMGSVKLKQKQRSRWSWWSVASRKGRGASLLGGLSSLLSVSSEKASQSYSSKSSTSTASETVHFVSKSGEVTRPSSGDMHVPDLELGEFFAGTEAERRLTGMIHQEK